jgi:RNA polymerase sigma-70 factor (ECF subfamily)
MYAVQQALRHALMRRLYPADSFVFTARELGLMLSENIAYERSLLERIANADEAAFREIFDLYRERFYAAALKLTRSPDTSEEIVQEIFVTLWLRRSALLKVRDPRAYLFAVAYHHISGHFRKLAREKRMIQALSFRYNGSECSTEDRLIDKENQLLLQHLIHQLPPQQQLIYQLSRKEGLSRDEIAHRLDISPHTVKNHLLKAMKYIHAHVRDALPVFICFFYLRK